MNVVMLLFGIAVIGVLLANLWPILLLIVVAVVVARIVAGMLDRQDSRLGEKHAREKALIARADAQHRQIMCGDEDAGTYGKFPPARW